TPLCWPTPDGRCGCPKQHTAPREIGKAPLLGAGHHEHRLTCNAVLTLIQRYPQANWGLLLQPSGLLVADADSDEADQEVERRGVPAGPRVKTARGIQRYFRNTSGIIGRTTKRGDSKTLDILADGYVVIAGSRHSTGRRYIYEVSLDDMPLTEAP